MSPASTTTDMAQPSGDTEHSSPKVHTNGAAHEEHTDAPAPKRRRTMEDTNGKEHAPPVKNPAISNLRLRLRESTSDPYNPKDLAKDICFYDEESDDTYEYIRLPKDRRYDLFRVARDAPEDRNKAAVPLVAIRPEDNQPVTMWAKMDTGADVNLINLSTLKLLLGSSIDASLQPNTLAEPKEYGSMGHTNFKTLEKHVKLSFRAGPSQKQFNNVRFDVVLDNWDEPNCDGIPNVVLGYDFLREHSMVMIDLEYHLDADPDLPVIAKKAEDEDPSQARILITKHPPRPGFVRPTVRPR